MNSKNIFPISIGSISGYVINDGVMEESFDARERFPHVLPSEIDPVLQAHGYDQDVIWVPRNCLYLNTEGQNVLVDTGLGHAWGGELQAGLSELHIDQNQIDHVIFTHCHGDHVAGALDRDRKLIYPNAKYWMWAQEWGFWSKPDRYGEGREYPENHPAQLLTQAIEDAVNLIENEEEFLPGIRPLPAAGHTRGHMALQISSGDENLLLLADLFLYPFQIENLEWCTPFDRYPEFTIESRKRALNLAEELEAQVILYHFESPGIGFVERAGSGWRWVGKHVHE